MEKKVDFRNSKGAIRAVARASDVKENEIIQQEVTIEVKKPELKIEVVNLEPEEDDDFDVKTSFVFSNNQVLKIKSAAFWEQRPIKTIMYEALGMWIKKHERAHGEIITPESKKK